MFLTTQPLQLLSVVSLATLRGVVPICPSPIEAYYMEISQCVSANQWGRSTALLCLWNSLFNSDASSSWSRNTVFTDFINRYHALPLFKVIVWIQKNSLFTTYHATRWEIVQSTESGDWITWSHYFVLCFGIIREWITWSAWYSAPTTSLNLNNVIAYVSWSNNVLHTTAWKSTVFNIS